MDRPKNPNAKRAPLALVLGLWVCAIMLAIGGPLYGTLHLLTAAGRDEVGALTLLKFLGYFVGGLSGGCLLWAVAWAVRNLREQRVVHYAPPTSEADRRNTAAAIQPPAAQQTHIPPDLADRVLAQLSEINTSLLMSEDERRAKARYRRSQLTEDLVAEAEKAIEAHDLAGAERAANRLSDEFGEIARREELLRRISEARAAAQAESIAAEARRVEELMSVASFRQAENAARELLANYPNSAEAQSLLDRVLREADAFSIEQRKRLYREVHRAAEARQWRSAFTSAQRLLAEYPDSAEADRVALRMPTIQENARIEEARQLRDDIRELIQRRRYNEAVAIARDILARFPDTQAATELRGQMERLEKLAKGD